MTTRTRNFVIVSLAVLGIGFGSGLVAYYVGFPAGALGRQGGPAELAFEETPLGKRWQDTFVRREGGKDKADALNKRFGEMVLQERTELVMTRFK